MLRSLPAMLLLSASLSAAQGVQVDPNLPVYKPVQGVSGSIKSEGSDTMNNLMTLWGEGFARFYPNVDIEIQGKGSSTGPPALITGAATFAPMSRTMRDGEVDAFEKAFGYKPVALPASIDMLAVYVHKDNPLAGMTLQQVDAVFSKSRRGGHDRDIVTWGDLGLTGEWADKKISIYGRNSASGTYGYFKEHGLFRGDFKDEVKEQPGSSAVVQGVATDRYSIGYSGIGYKTAGVRALALASDARSEMVEAIPENAYTGEYPLARFLYLYVNYRPGSQLEPLRREFLSYVFSREGQDSVIKDGYFPLPAPICRQELDSVGIEMKAATEAAAPARN
jgi:phosphate transport system substrate-binding protein